MPGVPPERRLTGASASGGVLLRFGAGSFAFPDSFRSDGIYPRPIADVFRLNGGKFDQISLLEVGYSKRVIGPVVRPGPKFPAFLA